jgi:hypothetical protein
MPERSILDARLAEIDRRLRTIQSGLEPAVRAVRSQRNPPARTGLDPPAPVVAPNGAPMPKRLTGDVGALHDLVARLTALVAAQERLLASARELTKRREPTGAGASVTVSTGPFASTEALRRFERALHTLPEVRSAAVREYEGADRAILDVHLVEPTP